MSTSGPFSETPDGVRLSVRLTPRARQNALEGVREGRLLVHVTAPPEDGKANRALLKLLSKRLGIRASAIELVGGTTSRNKELLLRGAKLAELPLADLLGAGPA